MSPLGSAGDTNISTLQREHSKKVLKGEIIEGPSLVKLKGLGTIGAVFGPKYGEKFIGITSTLKHKGKIIALHKSITVRCY